MANGTSRGHQCGPARSSRNLSRRDILRYGGTFAAAAAALTTINGQRIAAQDAGEQITVRVSNAPPENQPEAQKVFEQTIARYEEAHPNINIEATTETWDPQTFPARLAAGTLTDAFGVPFTEPQGIIARGQAADVTEYLKQWDHFESFLPTALAVVQNAEGRLFGFPTNGYALGLLYNRAFFEEAGLDPNQPPDTWDELREAAKALTGNGRAGFAETSTNNQGGWHFTAWMYSAGAPILEQRDGAWFAVFNNETGVEVLQLLKDMRFTDRSMPERQLLEQSDTRQMMATGQVAMSIQAPDALPYIRDTFRDADITQYGLGIFPQNGGNATLSGGSVWMFNPVSPPEVLAAAVDFSLFREFDLENFEATLQAEQERGALIGWPQLPLFTGEFEALRQAIIERYSNAPVENYQPFIQGSANITLMPEPPVESQQLYAAIDVAVQAVLTDEGASPKELLDQAAQQFQTQVLDPLNG